MRRDYVDCLSYLHNEFERHYLGKWNIKEEKNMDIPGKIRADLKCIYGANDPLNYIEDVKLEPRCITGAEENSLIVKLRVPSRMEKYVASTGFARTMPVDMTNALPYSIFVLGHFPDDSQVEVKKSEKRDPMELVDFLKPKKIIYSGRKTIVFWPDGTKTLVSLMEGQEHDEYSAFCAAVVKKMFGATHKAKKFLQSVAVRPEPKPGKEKDDSVQEQGNEYVEYTVLGQEEAVQVKVNPDVQVVPAPTVKEENCNG